MRSRTRSSQLSCQKFGSCSVSAAQYSGSIQSRLQGGYGVCSFIPNSRTFRLLLRCSGVFLRVLRDSCSDGASVLLATSTCSECRSALRLRHMDLSTPCVSTKALLLDRDGRHHVRGGDHSRDSSRSSRILHPVLAVSPYSVCSRTTCCLLKDSTYARLDELQIQIQRVHVLALGTDP